VPGTDVVVVLDGNEMFPLAQADGDAERVAEVADRVQQWFIETVLWTDRATNSPPCPWHRDGHPLVPRAIEAGAARCCPVDGAPAHRLDSWPVPRLEPGRGRHQVRQVRALGMAHRRADLTFCVASFVALH
jgi:hypothetical protein